MKNLQLMSALALLASENYKPLKESKSKTKKSALSLDDPEYKRQRNLAKAERKRNKKKIVD